MELFSLFWSDCASFLCERCHPGDGRALRRAFLLRRHGTRKRHRSPPHCHSHHAWHPADSCWPIVCSWCVFCMCAARWERVRRSFPLAPCTCWTGRLRTPHALPATTLAGRARIQCFQADWSRDGRDNTFKLACRRMRRPIQERVPRQPPGTQSTSARELFTPGDVF